MEVFDDLRKMINTRGPKKGELVQSIIDAENEKFKSLIKYVMEEGNALIEKARVQQGRTYAPFRILFEYEKGRGEKRSFVFYADNPDAAEEVRKGKQDQANSSMTSNDKKGIPFPVFERLKPKVDKWIGSNMKGIKVRVSAKKNV